MSETPRGLGRGLDALFRNNDGASGDAQRQNTLGVLPLAALVPNPGQPRRHFAPEALEELAASIRSQGIVQPLLVRPSGNARYEIIAGERRWRAAGLAGLAEVPVLIRQLSDMEIMATALIENLQREDLNPMEEARAMAGLRDKFGLSQDEIAGAIGKSRPAIANALRLLNLSPDAQDALEKSRISAGHARAILSLGSIEAQSELLMHCIQDKLNVRDAEYAATLWKEEGVFPWLKIEDEEASARQDHGGIISGAKPPLRKGKSSFLQQAQKQLRQELKIQVSISGTETHGRISLGYQNTEEFYTLLRLLGISAADDAREQPL